MDYLRHHHPEVPVIGDAKRGDIASTAEAYAKFLFDRLGFDAVTLNPYLGSDSLTPFLERPDRGCIIVCRTSNPSADDLQTADVGGVLLWQRVLEYTADKWNSNNNCLAVIGGTRPDDLRIARQIAGKEMFFLVPGIGAQGADLEAVLAAGLTKMHNNARDRERDVENGRGEGLIINSSRAIATKPAEATKNLRDKINSLRA